MAAILSRGRWVNTLTAISVNAQSHILGSKPMCFISEKCNKLLQGPMQNVWKWWRWKHNLVGPFSDTYICASKLTTNGLSDWRQAIIWTNGGMLLIGPLGTNFSENLIKIHIFSSEKMQLKMSPGKWWPFYLDLSVLIYSSLMKT